MLPVRHVSIDTVVVDYKSSLSDEPVIITRSTQNIACAIESCADFLAIGEADFR